MNTVKQIIVDLRSESVRALALKAGMRELRTLAKRHGVRGKSKAEIADRLIDKLKG